MKIERIEVMRWENEANKPIGCRIYTDAGIYGDGEAALAYGNASNAAYGILLDFAPLIIGMDPFDTEVIWEKLFKETFWGQNGGPVTYAGISALDLALWDIKGKALNLPVYKLLGGKQREKLRVYASQLQFGWSDIATKDWKLPQAPEDYARAVRLAVEEGYDAVKIDFFTFDADGRSFTHDERTGLLKPYYLRLIESRMEAIRGEVGYDVDIIMENHSYTDTASAIQLAEVAEKYKIFCFEEPNTPFPKTNEKLSRYTKLPIAQGERLYGRWQYAPFFENGSLLLIQPDLGNCGGLTEGKKICDMAYTYDVGVQCHICSTPLSIMPALHLESVIPNFVIHEHHMIFLVPENIKMVKYNYQPVNGYYTVPDLPGMGNEWSEHALNTCKQKEVFESQAALCPSKTIGGNDYVNKDS